LAVVVDGANCFQMGGGLLAVVVLVVVVVVVGLPLFAWVVCS